MDFTKMNGLGNDFVVVQHRDVPFEVNLLAEQICDRHFGIGADGLVFILPSDKADYRMRIFNADGSEAEQCGNAIRCVSKYIYDHGMANKTTLSIETLAGIQYVSLNVNAGNKVESVRVDMGEPILQGNLVPTIFSQDKVINQTIEVEGKEFTFTAVSMGNPHAIIYISEDIDVKYWGPKIENHPYFPKKTNVEFVRVKNKKEVDMRVWERGVGETLACGTGACATAVASVLTNQTEREVIVHLLGGDLYIKWSTEDNHVYMTGAVEEVFQGKWLKTEVIFPR